MIKFVLAYVFFIFFITSDVKADDIRDFQIEGMSVGDSLLDYLPKSEIKKNFYPNSKKFAYTFHNEIEIHHINLNF